MFRPRGKFPRNPSIRRAVYGAMHCTSILFAAATLLIVSGCATQKPVTSTRLEPGIREKVEKGIIEPGFTPEMVYLALGKPSEPDHSLADATTDGTWVYHDFNPGGGNIVKAGFRRRVVFDPAKKIEIVTTEPIEPEKLRAARSNSLHVTFREGRVVEIERIAGM